MKKNIQYAFGMVLIILAIVGSIWKTEYFENIIYAVVVPTFILSAISFIEEIVKKCENDAQKESELNEKLAELKEKNVEMEYELYNKKTYELPYIEGQVPKKIYEMREGVLNNLKNSIAAKNVSIFCLRLNKICGRLTTIGYIILFLSLIMTPYIVNWLSDINLNCITLWSLTILYLTLEMKEEICVRIYKALFDAYLKKQENDLKK